MASIYKYLRNERYARALIERGQLYLQSLAYFRIYEDKLVRGDPDDGRLRYEPEEGLKVIKIDGEVVALPPGWQFRSSVREADIFVYCCSLERSELLAEKFESPFCVEIKDVGRLLAKAKACVRLRARLDRRRVYGGSVEYRDVRIAPGVDWALPERIAFIKPEAWAWQAEYRLVVGRKGAFAAENVDLALENGSVGLATSREHEPLILTVGNLSRFAELHRF